MRSSALPGTGSVAGRLKVTFELAPPRPKPPDSLLVGGSGGVVDMSLLSSGHVEAWHVDGLQLETVRVVEERRVIPRDVGVLLRLALELQPPCAHPCCSIVDRRRRAGLGVRVCANASLCAR